MLYNNQTMRINPLSPNLPKSLAITTPNQGRNTFHTMQAYQSIYFGDAIHPISRAWQWLNSKPGLVR
jgi:hypothetical protein